MLSDKFESHNSLKLSFTNIWGLVQVLLIANLSLNHNHSNSIKLKLKLAFLLYVRQTWMTQFILANSLWGLPFLNPNEFYYSCAWSFSFCGRRTLFCTGLISGKPCRFLLMFSTSLTLLSVLLRFLLLIIFFVFMHAFWFCFI